MAVVAIKNQNFPRPRFPSSRFTLHADRLESIIDHKPVPYESMDHWYTANCSPDALTCTVSTRTMYSISAGRFARKVMVISPPSSRIEYTFDSKQISSWSLSTIVTVASSLGPALTPREDEDGGMNNFKAKYSLPSTNSSSWMVMLIPAIFPPNVGWKMAADEWPKKSSSIPSGKRNQNRYYKILLSNRYCVVNSNY